MLWLLLACATDPQPPSAEEVAYGEESVAAALSRIEARLPEVAPEGDAGIDTRLRMLEERLSQVELAVSELQTTGVLAADKVGYDPRATTLGGRNAQEALDELATRLLAAEKKLDDDMGAGNLPGTKVEDGPGGPPGGGGKPPGKNGPPGPTGPPGMPPGGG